MRRAAIIIVLFAAYAIILESIGSPSGATAGMWAGLLVMARLVDNPPRNFFGGVAFANRQRQVASAVVMAAIGVAVLSITPTTPSTFKWLNLAIRFAAFFSVGAAISLFVYKDARSSYAEWSRKVRKLRLRDGS